MQLVDKKCVPCEGGMPPLTQEEAEKLHREVSDWKLEDTSLSKEFSFKDFDKAMDFVNVVADKAEIEGHHPDIDIRYNKVLLTLTTHAIGGLSENDFILAAKINSIRL